MVLQLAIAADNTPAAAAAPTSLSVCWQGALLLFFFFLNYFIIEAAQQALPPPRHPHGFCFPKGRQLMVILALSFCLPNMAITSCHLLY